MELNSFKQRVADEVVKPIREYMAEYDIEDFSAEDVQKCGSLLNSYLEALAALTNPTDEAIMAQVEKVVLALNELNEATDYALIETSERESICILIQDAAVECGLKADLDDVTEEWREW